MQSASTRLLDQPMSDEDAQAVILAQRGGRTLNSICSKRNANGGWITYRSRYLAYCGLHPGYAVESEALQIENTKAMNARKGRPLKFCMRGHLMAGDNLAWKPDVKDGKLYRYCKACHRFRSDRGGEMKPALVRRVTEAVNAGLNIEQITRPRNGRKCIVNFATLKRYRIEHPAFDRFIIENSRAKQARAVLRRCLIVPSNAALFAPVSTFIKPVRKELPPYLYQEGDLEWISSLIPSGFPGGDDVVQNLFTDLCPERFLARKCRRASER
jgi:hypothetical protein